MFADFEGSGVGYCSSCKITTLTIPSSILLAVGLPANAEFSPRASPTENSFLGGKKLAEREQQVNLAFCS